MVGKTATEPRMGRPPMGMKEFKVQLDPEQIARVDARVGTYRRSGFIREAIRRELERMEKDEG